MTKPTTTVRTIIIPAAGKGTRMLPATQVTAKELLPVYDRPVIQFAIDEAIEAGAERIIVVVNDRKPAIREFLGDVAYPSTGTGTARNASAQVVPEIVYVTQALPLGLGHAVLLCKGLTLAGPFGIILPDDIIMGRGGFAEMAQNYRHGHMIAAMTVPDHQTSRYGIFAPSGAATDICIPVSGMVEKPQTGTAPSSLAAVGRYILQPMIFDILARTTKGAGGELQLTDAIAVATLSVPLTAFRFSGTRYDCGSHDGLLAASIARQAAVRATRVTASLSVARPSARSPQNGKANGLGHSGLVYESAQQPF